MLRPAGVTSRTRNLSRENSVAVYPTWPRPHCPSELLIKTTNRTTQPPPYKSGQWRKSKRIAAQPPWPTPL
ncbi:hypothetical protein BC936DRAFT_145858 [Jimgerdemannia flammicorona]|uniref:Uncharacterized protein n=1 Tax=Jimgerdemannia flammicorona TaxID=994334 RepID=A0A433D8W7_9FUNG|nr:hypothetical protein BC936DRAFT_145858 [Jimgerdemannia flammicorona]